MSAIFEFFFMFLGAAVRMLAEFGFKNWTKEKFKEKLSTREFLNFMISVSVLAGAIFLFRNI